MLSSASSTASPPTLFLWYYPCRHQRPHPSRLLLPLPLVAEQALSLLSRSPPLSHARSRISVKSRQRYPVRYPHRSNSPLLRQWRRQRLMPRADRSRAAVPPPLLVVARVPPLAAFSHPNRRRRCPLHRRHRRAPPLPRLRRARQGPCPTCRRHRPLPLGPPMRPVTAVAAVAVPASEQSHWEIQHRGQWLSQRVCAPQPPLPRHDARPRGRCTHAQTFTHTPPPRQPSRQQPTSPLCSYRPRERHRFPSGSGGCRSRFSPILPSPSCARLWSSSRLAPRRSHNNSLRNGRHRHHSSSKCNVIPYM